jgi:hypothetical protein
MGTGRTALMPGDVPGVPAMNPPTGTQSTAGPGM